MMIRENDRTVRMSATSAKSLADLAEANGHTSIAGALDAARELLSEGPGGVSSAAVMLHIDRDE